MENNLTIQTSQDAPNKRRFFEAFPIIQFIVGGIIAVCATWTTIQLAQNSQAAELKKQGEKIEKLEKDSTPRELFDERTNRILDEQKKLGEKLDKIFDKK